MTRHLCLATLFLFAAMLAACGGGGPEPSPSAQPTAPPVEVAEVVDDGRGVSSPPQRDEIFSGGEFGGRVVIGALGDPKTFNVITANESSSTDIINRLWAALTSYNNVTQEVIPGLAHQWEHDEAGTTWTFRLREGLVFSDGSPLTSESVDRFFRVTYTEELANPGADIFNIDGDPFTWETPDDLTVLIHTPGVFAQMPLMGNNIIPLPAEPWEAALASENPADALNLLHGLDTDPDDYVCSGPFRLGAYNSGETTVIRRSEFYQMWDAQGRRLPYLDEVVFVNVPDTNAMRMRFAAGETDELNPLRPQHYVSLRDNAEEGGYTVWDLGPTLGKSFFWFNLKPGVNADSGEPHCDPTRLAWFQNVDFRRACAHAIDRQAMCDIVFNGRATPKIAFESVSNIFWCNTEATHYPYDPDRARALLDSIGMIDRDNDGVREDADGNPITFTMITNRGNDTRERMIVMIEEDLAAIGIDLVPSTIEFNALVTRIADTYQYEACLLGLGGGTPDPTTGLNVLRSSGRTHQWNPSQDSPATEAEARIDALCDQLVNTLDIEEQRLIYNEIQDILGRECYMIWTIDANTYVGTQDRVGNWMPAIVDPRTTWNIESLCELSAR